MKKIALLLLGFVALFGLEAKNLEFKTVKNLLQGRLENNLKYYIYKNSTPKNSAAIYLHINAGSTNENEDQKGLAHFVEHMVFNGSEDYNKTALIGELEGLGVKFGPDLNAATSFDKTFYKINIKTDQKSLKSAFCVLENMAFKALFNQEDIDSEKGIIIEEERMRRDARMRIFEQEIPYIYRDSIYAKRLPIGDMDIVRGATKAKMLDFYHKNYQPKNMSIIAVGDFNAGEIEKLIISHFAKYSQNTPNLNPNRKIDFFNKSVIFNAHDKEIGLNSLKIGFESDYVGGIDSYENFKADYENRYITRLISMISDKRTGSGEALQKMGYFSVDLMKQKNLNIFYTDLLKDDYLLGIKDIYSVINGVREFGFNEADFESVKREFISENENFIAGKETKDNDYFIHNLFMMIDDNSTFLSLEDRYKFAKIALDEITLADINEKFRLITNSKGLIIEVISQDKITLDEKKINEQKNAPSYDTRVGKMLPSELFDDRNLSVKKPIAFEFDKENGINTFTFQNGAKVIHKELNTKKDSVAFMAIKKGGTSNFKSEKEPNLAVQISNSSGFGEFNDYEVRVITANENFSLNKFINEVSLGYSGNSTTKDFKNLLKALYYDIQNPRIDESYLARFKELWLDNHNKNIDNPDYKFAREFNRFYYQNSEKKSPLEPKDIEKLNAKVLGKFLNDEFKNADFTYIIVGDIKKEDILEIMGRYAGNLSVKKEENLIKDDGIRSIKGEQIFLKDYLKENQAKSLILIKNENVKFSPKSLYTLDATAEVLSVLLRENIREKDSSVYSISAGGALGRYPYSSSIVNIGFSSNPLKVGEIVANTKSIIKYMQENLLEERYLQNYKESKKISLKKNFESPNFWLNVIKDGYILDEAVLNYATRVDIIDSLSLADIQEGARIYLNLENFVTSSLVFKGTKESTRKQK